MAISLKTADLPQSVLGEVVDVAKYKAYNGDFLVFDSQPGRNTFIDAKTGRVRFIDPRIMLNTPEENFSAASRFGKRKPYDKPLRLNVNFDRPELSPEAAHDILTVRKSYSETDSRCSLADLYDEAVKEHVS